MDFPWIPLIINFLLLGAALFICRTINASQGNLAWNGALVFFIFCLIAMVFDFTLTMVFASASFHDRSEYETLASRTAWSERIFSYLIPWFVSMLHALRFRRRQRFASVSKRRESGSDAVKIQTSPYTQSELTL
ncbi:hypothetical protein BHUM_02691c [Candidatus Burkholderia humilis]|nr:hypothetical protein BHUM_02691c [Candidatus Burkholderia humilis]